VTTLARRSSRRGARDGAAAIEFALVAPILLALLVPLIDLGMGSYIKAQVQTAAQAGAEYAEMRGWNPLAIRQAVLNATGLTALSVTPSVSCGCISGTSIVTATCGNYCPSGRPPGTYVTVAASASYTSLIPYPGLDRTTTFRASSVVRIN
jgi:Flp pilus assembly protein TadG